MSNEYRVLITGAGSKGVPGLIKDLRKSDEKFYIVTVDTDHEAVGNLFSDNSYVVPPWSENDYISTIIGIVKRERIKYIIPNDDFEGLMKFCQLSKTNRDLHIAVTKDQKCLSTAMNKLKLYEFLEENQMLNYVPKYVFVNDISSLLSAIKKFGYPQKKVAIKPVISEGSRGFKIICDYKKNFFEERGCSEFISIDDLSYQLNHIDNIPQILVMEYLPGEEYSIDVLLSKGGSIEYMVPRVRTKITEGVSVRGIIKKNDEIEEKVVNILNILPLEYAVNIQMKYSEKGEPKLIEINPRVSGTMTFCSGAGINMHYYLILLLAGKTLPKLNLLYNTKMYRYYDEKYVFE